MLPFTIEEGRVPPYNPDYVGTSSAVEVKVFSHSDLAYMNTRPCFPLVEDDLWFTVTSFIKSTSLIIVLSP